MGAYGEDQEPRAPSTPLDRGLRPVSPAGRAAQADRGHAVGRRAADLLSIGRALLADPKILFSTSRSMGLARFLSPRSSRSCTEINRQGMTVLLVEQNRPPGPRAPTGPTCWRRPGGQVGGGVGTAGRRERAQRLPVEGRRRAPEGAGRTALRWRGGRLVPWSRRRPAAAPATATAPRRRRCGGRRGEVRFAAAPAAPLTSRELPRRAVLADVHRGPLA